MMSDAAATAQPRSSAATLRTGDGCSGSARPKSCRKACYGSARASALAAVDRRYYSNALIVADLSYDPTYAEVLLETFGQRVIGLHISRHGDGMNSERRPVRHGYVLVYTIGRNYLIELFHARITIRSGPICRWTDDAPRL